jgi:hypothetical protein
VAAQRPAGITLLGILFIILGIISLLWGLLLFNVGAISSITGAIFGAENLATFGGNNAGQGLVSIASAVLDFVVAYGLLGLRRWGWLLALIGVGVAVMQGVLGLFSGGVWTFVCGAAGLIIPAVILYYLLKPEVRRAFGQ